MRDKLFDDLMESALIWLPQYGVGYYPVKETPYDEAYFDKYVTYSNTEMGKELTKKRAEFVNKYFNGILIDIGIGCGDFIKYRTENFGVTYGFDINPVAVKRLQESNKFLDPYSNKVKAVSLWDVLEHIHDQQKLLDMVEEWVFVSMPIYKDGEQVLRSKHFKPQEHCWYWTQAGLIRWMFAKGFSLAGVSNFETELGREDIETFAFKRI